MNMFISNKEINSYCGDVENIIVSCLIPDVCDIVTSYLSYDIIRINISKHKRDVVVFIHGEYDGKRVIEVVYEYKYHLFTLISPDGFTERCNTNPFSKWLVNNWKSHPLHHLGKLRKVYNNNIISVYGSLSYCYHCVDPLFIFYFGNAKRLEYVKYLCIKCWTIN
jgi:hypothetical protein